jgi:ATP-dependent Lon protease
MAAHRAGIRRIILPDRNASDVEKIPEDVRKELEIISAVRISDVLNAALEPASQAQKAEYAAAMTDGNRDAPAGDPLVAQEK